TRADVGFPERAHAATMSFVPVSPLGRDQRATAVGRHASTNRTPRRRILPMTASVQPSKGWRSRVIITESGKSRRWVVCSRFLRQYRLGAGAHGGPSSYELRVGAALHRALAEGAGANGGRQRRAAHSGNAAGRGHHSPERKR